MNGPTVQEERHIDVASLVSDWKRSGLVTPDEAAAAQATLDTGWRTSGSTGRVAFFVFGVFGVSCLFGLFAVFSMPFKGFMSAVAACGLAEALIRNKRLYHAGIEEGLYLAGLCAFIAGLPGEEKVEALLLFAVAFAAAGVRTRTALVALGAPLLVVAYIAIKDDSLFVAGLVSLAMGVAASIARLRPIARPLVDTILVFALIVFPLIAWAMLSFEPHKNAAVVIAIFGIVAMGEWIFAVRRRSHAHFVAAMLMTAAVGYEVFARIRWTVDGKLVAAGAVLFAIALVIDRLLRDGEAVTSKKLLETELMRAGELVASSAVAATTAAETRAIAETEPAHTGGGGGFGGAGASGEY